MNKALYFAFGFAVGAAGAWYVCKSHYQKIADEEIRSVIDEFNSKKTAEGKFEKKEPDSVPEVNLNEPIRQKQLQDYRSMVRDAGYRSRTSPKDLLEDNPNEPTPGDDVVKPYSISPEEFDTLDDYDAVCYTYYADGVLVDEDEAPLELHEIASAIGLDYASHFGDYDEDSAYFRNELRKIDYEVIRDLRKYGDFHDTE